MRKGQIGVQELVFAALFLIAGVGIFLFASGMLGGLGEMGGGFWEQLGEVFEGAEEAWTPDPIVNNSVTAIGEMFERLAVTGRTLSPEFVCEGMDGEIGIFDECPKEKVKAYLYGGRVCCG